MRPLVLIQAGLCANGNKKGTYIMNEKTYDLIIFDEREQMKSISLNQFGKKQIVIGRESGSADVVCTNSSVSRSHGCLILEEDGVWYRDLNSMNGTRVMEGAFEYRLYQSDEQVAVSDNTCFKIGRDEKSVLFLVRRTYPEAGWKKVAIGNRKLTIGRTQKNDVIFDSPLVSREHAVVYEEQGQAFICDCKSHNGTRVNNSWVQGKRTLLNGDIIGIVDNQLIYHDGILYYYTRVQGVHLVANDLYKTVRQKKKKFRREKKTLLNHVNLEISSNDFVAIVGGSGTGKTTLMNAISGFDRKCSGQILFNGIPLRKNFNRLKEMIGYVPQQEIIYENLTLRSMLYYTAKMKMPKDTDKEEIESRIEEVLDMVELSEHSNTYIRKLSGGQKKRASIAVELLADPKLFLLDEPTSGLDPGTERNLMQMLNRLSKTRDKTTILVTHTTQNLHLCDKVVFVGPEGYLCFYGSVEQAKMFFQTDDLVNIYNIIAQDPAMWAEQFRRCVECRPYVQEEKVKAERLEKQKISKTRQTGVLIARYGKLIWNDKKRLGILLLQPLVIAYFLYLVVDKDEMYSIYETTQTMMFSLSCVAIWIGLFNSIQEICKERSILRREYMGCLKLPLYIVSKVVLQFLLAAVQALLLLTVFAVAVGKNPKGIWFDSFFFEMYLTVLLAILASMAIGLVISSLVKSGDKAMTLAPFVLIFQLLFSGILFSLEGPSEMLSYGTVSKWSVEAMGSITDLNNLSPRLQEQFPSYVREAQEIYEHTGAHLLMTWGIMAGMTIACLVLSCVLLRNVKNDSR